MGGTTDMPVDLVGLLKGAARNPQQRPDLDDSVWAAVQSAGGRQWRKGDEIAGGLRLLIGIASYHLAELKLAERLLEVPPLHGCTIEFFNIMDIKNMQGFEDYIPGIKNVWGTPVVGLWRDGTLERAAWGRPGVHLIQTIIPEAWHNDVWPHDEPRR